MDLGNDDQWLLIYKKKREIQQVIFWFLLGEHTITYEGVLFKRKRKKHLDLIKAWGRTSNLLEVQGKEERVKWRYGDAVNKTWTLGDSAGQMTRFLQQITSKGKRCAEGTYRLN